MKTNIGVEPVAPVLINDMYTENISRFRRMSCVQKYSTSLKAKRLIQPVLGRCLVENSYIKVV